MKKPDTLIPFVILTGLVLLFAGWFLMWFRVATRDQKGAGTRAPAFAVGDCLTWTGPTERWEQNHIIWRIEEVGHHSYRIRYYGRDGALYPDSFSRGFDFDTSAKTISCPSVRTR